MEKHTALPEERTLAPWLCEEERLSQAEYQYALARLQRFVEEVAVNPLLTLEDLSAVASLVGHDASVLAVTQGKKCEKTMEPSVGASMHRVEREYVFTRGLGRLEVVVIASKGHCLLSRYRLLGFHGYRSEELSIRLPADRDIGIGEKPNVNEQSLYAKDARRAERVYYPTREPESPEIQQVFARLLKELLREIVADLI